MTVSREILIVEDDAMSRQALAEQLQRHQEFAVTQASTAAQAFEIVTSQYFAAIILDVGLPDMDGRELCRLMRRAGITIPILMLAGAASDADMILGLDSGASDYIAKPVPLDVLRARVLAQLRPQPFGDDDALDIGPYSFRPSAKLLTDRVGRKEIRLTQKETTILKYLYAAGDRVTSRVILSKEILGDNSSVALRAIEDHIHRLRRKIESDPKKPQILVTERGGYRLVS